jgi:hypothetical protein
MYLVPGTIPCTEYKRIKYPTWRCLHILAKEMNTAKYSGTGGSGVLVLSTPVHVTFRQLLHLLILVPLANFGNASHRLSWTMPIGLQTWPIS